MQKKPEDSPNRLEQALDRVAVGDYIGASLLAAKYVKDEFTRPILPPTSKRVYVGNIDYEVTDQNLFDLFSGYGEVQEAKIAKDSKNRRSKGFGFVTMATHEQALLATQQLDGGIWHGRKIVVGGVKEDKFIG